MQSYLLLKIQHQPLSRITCCLTRHFHKYLTDAEFQGFIPKTVTKQYPSANAMPEDWWNDVDDMSPSIEEKYRSTIENKQINENRYRLNPLGVQMLSSGLHKQIFGDTIASVPNASTIQMCQNELRRHQISSDNVTNYLPDIEFQLPPLKGANIIEHFKNIASEQIEPYKDLIEHFITVKIPQVPEEWCFQSGWTRYENGRPPESVDYPSEHALVFDIEVCLASGKAPTLAVALSTHAWYAWISDTLINGTTKPVRNHQYSEDALIPIENPDTNQIPKIIIGHNVSFDRARIREQYWLKQTGARFLDTMSLHISVSGLSSFQRNTLKSADKEDTELDSLNTISSLNNLSDVHQLYCGHSLDKATKDLFVEGTMQDVKDNFQEAIKYCASDVLATFNVLKQLYPLFLERFPHPATLAGMLELGSAYLPVNQNWNQYVEESEQTFEDLKSEATVLLTKRADQICKLFHNEQYKRDLWMWDQDWSVKHLKLRKQYKEIDNFEFEMNNEDDEDEDIKRLQSKFNSLWCSAVRLPKIRPVLPGYPNWYRKLCTRSSSDENWLPGPHLISTSMQITPKLLGLTWEGYPLHYIRGEGWGYLVPFTENLDEVEDDFPLKELLEKCPLPNQKPTSAQHHQNPLNILKIVEENLVRKEYYEPPKVPVASKVGNCCYFHKLPHKNGVGNNVGNPLSKDFISKFSENILAGDSPCAEQMLTIARQLSYWRNNRNRIYDQMIVWLRGENRRYGAILPQVVVCGTLTRRAMEPTWMTASNAQPERIGSELRAMCQTPRGYSFVGADVDSQELWIASIIGDAHFAGMHGATPFGWMTLSGSKSSGTDMHSVTARNVRINRDQAKIINYARIYGAGQQFAERLLLQFNPAMSEGEVKSKARKMFTLTKGTKMYYKRDDDKTSYTKWDAYRIAKEQGKPLKELFWKPFWRGGTESEMFNRLEQIANSPEPRTPFLEARLSRAFDTSDEKNEKYLPTRVNWVVQSGAVDFLHLMLVSMRWLMGSKARFCLSFHDEIRYMVPDQYKYEAALAMHITNLLTRSYCSAKLGINDLPQSVAFFSGVEVDTVLRKYAGNDCKTPSNPHGLQKGYNIAPGETLDIFEAIRMADHFNIE